MSNCLLKGFVVWLGKKGINSRTSRNEEPPMGMCSDDKDCAREIQALDSDRGWKCPATYLSILPDGTFSSIVGWHRPQRLVGWLRTSTVSQVQIQAILLTSLSGQKGECLKCFTNDSPLIRVYLLQNTVTPVSVSKRWIFHSTVWALSLSAVSSEIVNSGPLGSFCFLCSGSSRGCASLQRWVQKGDQAPTPPAEQTAYVCTRPSTLLPRAFIR